MKNIKEGRLLIPSLVLMSLCYTHNLAAAVPTSQYWTDYLQSRAANSDLRKADDTLTDERVMPNFSYVGYEFGNAGLPSEGFSGYGINVPEFDPILTTHKIFDVTTYGAAPNDNISDKPAIKIALQAAQDYLADRERTVDSNGVPSFNKGAIVYFPQGKYLVNEDSDMAEFNLFQGNKGSGDDNARNKAACEQPFFVYADNIIIRGAGSAENGSELYMKNHFTTPYEDIMYSNAHLFMVGPFPQDYWKSGAAENTEHCAAKGEWKSSAEIIKTNITSTIGLRDSSRTFAVDDASSFAPGQWVRLRSLDRRTENIEAEVVPYLVESAWSKLKNGLDERQINRILSIDYINNEVTLVAPLLADIEAKVNGGNWTLESHNHSESIGFEHLLIKGNAVADFAHHQDYIHDNGWSGLLYNRTQNSWVKDVRFTSMSEGIQVKNAAANTIQDVTFDGNRGHLSFGLEVSSSVLALNIHEPSSYWHGAGPSSHSSGNVFLNYSFNADTAPNIHASQPRQNLYDNISGGWVQGHWGGASSSQPNHLNHLIFWNQTNNTESTKDFEFMQTNGIYGRIIMPYLIGNHGKNLPVATRQSYAEAQNNGNQHGAELQAYVESMGSVVKPYSLYESQVKQRFGELPNWLVKATNKVRFINIIATSAAGGNGDTARTQIEVHDRFGYPISQKTIEFSSYPSSQVVDLGDFYQPSKITFSADSSALGRLSGIQVSTRAYQQNSWQEVYSEGNFNGAGATQTVELIKPVYNKISYETLPPVEEPPYEGPTVEQIDGLSFSGNGDYVELSDIDYGEGDKLTVALWTKFAAQDSDAFIIRKSNYGTGNPFYIAATKTGYIQAKVNGKGPSKSGVGDQQWHHITMVLDGTVLSLYVDGVLTSTVADIVPVANDTKITIGGAANGSRSFKGEVDDVRIYQNALTAEQIFNLKNQPRIQTSDELNTDLCFNTSDADLVTFLPLQDRKNLTCNAASLDAADKGKLVNSPEWIVSLVPAPEAEKVEQVQGLSFSGNGDYVELPDIGYGADDKFTVSLWTRFGTQDSDAFIIRKSDYGTGNPFYIAATKTGYIQAKVNGRGPSKSGVGDENWHHVTMVLDGTILSLYVDGQLTSTMADIVPVSNTKNITIGGAPSGKRSFKGDVDDVRIYQSALTAEQVAQVANQSRIKSSFELDENKCFSQDESHLVVYLPLQDKQDVTCNAASLNNTKGLLINSPEWIVAMVDAPQAPQVELIEGLSFSGNGDYVELSDIGYGEGDKFTVALWTRFGSLENDAFIIRKSDYGTGNPFYIAATKSGYIQTKINGRGPSKSGINDETWHHITMVLDGTVLSLFVDGQLTSTVTDIVPVTNTKNITIGGAPSGNRSFKGDVDDVRIYQRALTAEQIAEVANSARISAVFELNDEQCLSYQEAGLVVFLPLQDKQDLTCNTVNENVSDAGLLFNFPQWIITLVDDSDNDSVADIHDVFAQDSSEWRDTDSDGTGNNADLDDDNDNVADSEDVFPLDASEWLDTDLDGTGNNDDTDDDNDDVADSDDAFPLDASEWLDTDFDGSGNNADTDDDNDNVADSDDAFPLDASEWLDTDLDGTGNNADTDDDNDGVEDEQDWHLEVVSGTVVFLSIETGILDRVDENGVPLSIVLSNKANELAESEVHGEFINELTRLNKDLEKSELINKDEWKLLKDIIHS